MKRTGPTNPVTRELVGKLRKESVSSKSALWRRIADDLEKPSRQRREVNVSHLARCTRPNDLVLVPGKVLGSGVLPHSITVAALSFSNSAREQIVAAKGHALSIADLLKKKPKLSDVRIIG